MAVVQVIAGSDKGTVAEVEKVLPAKGMIVVKGVNVKVRTRMGGAWHNTPKGRCHTAGLFRLLPGPLYARHTREEGG